LSIVYFDHQEDSITLGRLFRKIHDATIYALLNTTYYPRVIIPRSRKSYMYYLLEGLYVSVRRVILVRAEQNNPCHANI